MSTERLTDDLSVEELGRRLGEQIAELSEYEQFEAAQGAVERDEDVQAQIDEFERLRDEFMVARQTGEATQSDLEAVQRAQQELHSMPVMEQYLDAQEELEEALTEINEAISEPLSIDFGGESGGCCHD